MGTFETLLHEFATGQRAPRFPQHLRPRRDGLVALGGDLSVEMILEAYTRGFFPWSGDAPIPWYSPQPRLLLFPNYLHVSKSLQKTIRKGVYEVRFDTCFRDVMTACAKTPRKHEDDTWITPNMIDAYESLHHLHIAHSVEVFHEGTLCGGLYGLTLGRAFFGESMFAQMPNASKVALHALCQFLLDKDFDFVDCQTVTEHLLRMGAHPVTRKGYLVLLKKALQHPSHHYSWSDASQPIFHQDFS